MIYETAGKLNHIFFPAQMTINQRRSSSSPPDKDVLFLEKTSGCDGSADQLPIKSDAARGTVLAFR